MKKITLLFMLFFAIVSTNAQNYLISFAATGASTTLDSIKTENLTQSTSLTILGGDVLHLSGTVGINELTINEEMIKVSPNPMQEKAEISFYAKQAGNTSLFIYEISGKKVLQTNANHTKGIQKYQVSGLKEGVYFIKISGENYFHTSKLIIQNTIRIEAKIEYLGNEKTETVSVKPEITANKTKGTKSTIDMAYTTGDNLRFIGYSGTYSTTVLDVPTADETITFNLSSHTCGDTLTDIRNGKTYSTVLIGSQCWMAQNLNIGSKIAGATNQANNSTIEKYCYNDLETNCDIYGGLYQWAETVQYLNGATNTTSWNPLPMGNVQGICPSGWHIPTHDEWTTLERTVCTSATCATDFPYNNTTTGYRGTDEGNKLKESGTSHWANGNNGTNSSNFTALPGGYRDTDNTFYNISTFGYWWTATAYSSSYAWNRNPYYSFATVFRYGYHKAYGFGVRCVKD